MSRRSASLAAAYTPTAVGVEGPEVGGARTLLVNCPARTSTQDDTRSALGRERGEGAADEGPAAAGDGGARWGDGVCTGEPRADDGARNDGGAASGGLGDGSSSSVGAASA